MGSDESHFNVPVGSDGQSHRTVSTNNNLFEEKAEAASNRGPSAYQPNARARTHTHTQTKHQQQTATKLEGVHIVTRCNMKKTTSERLKIMFFEACGKQQQTNQKQNKKSPLAYSGPYV